MLKAGLEALARLQLEGYHAQPAASTQQQQQQQQPHEQAAQQQPGSAEHGNEEQGPLPLHELPSDVLGKIIMHLSTADIHNLLAASQGLHDALQDDALWHTLCIARWGALTDVQRWIVPPLPPTTPGTPGRVTLPLPQTFRKLYMLLHETAPIVGLWRLVGEGPRGALIAFRWTRDGIEGIEVECRKPLSGRTDPVPWARICPARGLTTAVAVDQEGSYAAVTVYGAQGQRILRSPSAEAAAAVALPHSQASSSPLGSSPLGSFESEWLAFMTSSISHGRSKQRRRSQRGMGGPARPEGPAIYHLKRVEQPQPSTKHPHCGLWAGDYGPSGLEVLQLRYDFKGRAAQLQAWKVTGDECVPAGQCSWRAKAAPLRHPLPPEDAELVAQQEERWLAQWEWLLDAEDSDSDGGGSTRGTAPGAPPSPATAKLPRSRSTGSAASGGGGDPRPPGSPRGPPRVVAVHEGSGQVAGPGFQHPEWVAGRLLVFEDGSLSFVWQEGLNQVTEMRRLRLPRR